MPWRSTWRCESGPGRWPAGHTTDKKGLLSLLAIGNAEATSCRPDDLPTRSRDAPMDPPLLVVDDNEDSRSALTVRLNTSGYGTVLTAENGRQALDMIRARPIDLVLLDVMMPEVDGYRVLEAMRADPALRAIPVLVISAVDDMASIVKCIKLGATDYLVKPFNAVLLNARVSGCVDQLRLRALEATYKKNLESEKRRADGILATV